MNNTLALKKKIVVPFGDTLHHYVSQHVPVYDVVHEGVTGEAYYRPATLELVDRVCTRCGAIQGQGSGQCRGRR